MTDKEKEELKFRAVCIDASSDFPADYDELEDWVEAKKKSWEEEAFKQGVGSKMSSPFKDDND